MARRDRYSCAVCDAPARPPFRAAIPDGPPDLDLRPGEPVRSTLHLWLETCRSCGAAAPDLSALPLSAAEVVRSENYRLMQRHAAHVRPFLRWARLCPAHLRGEVLLQAAWAEDDAGNDAAAAALRLRAVRAWGHLPPEQRLRLVDVLRRAADWDAALAQVDALMDTLTDPSSRSILHFQRDRITARDAGRYQMANALPPPACRPHVVHSRAPVPARQKPGLLDRLLRRSVG